MHVEAGAEINDLLIPVLGLGKLDRSRPRLEPKPHPLRQPSAHKPEQDAWRNVSKQ